MNELLEKVAPPDAIPQERITGDILRGRGPRRGNLEDLLRYWRPIMRKPGGFRRCVIILADHPKLSPPQRICAWLHHETTGKWPNEGNHHGRKRKKRTARSVAGVTRRATRRARRKSGDDWVGLDIPEDGMKRRIMRKNKSVLYEPIAGRRHIIDFKVNRFLEGAASTVLPGEAHPLRVSPTRQIAFSLVFPGGVGPNIGAPGGGGVPRNPFRCPSGFTHGGRFSNRTLSNCGPQLFTVPGGQGTPQQVRRAVGARAAAIEAETGRGSLGRSVGSRTGTTVSSRSINAPRSTNVRGIAPKPVSRNNPTRRDSTAASLVRKMNKSKKDNITRFVRRDGSVVSPSAPLATIARQRKNDDLQDAVAVLKVSDLGPNLGVLEASLFGAGVREVRFALPGGVDARLKAKKKLSPADAGRLQRAAQSVSSSTYKYDVGGAIRQAGASTGLAELDASVPRVSDPNTVVSVRTPGGATRQVPRWVYETYLSAGASKKLKGAGAHTLVAGKKQLFAHERLGVVDNKVANNYKNRSFGVVEKVPLAEWGPLEYTASPIPQTRDEGYWNTVAYKAAAFTQSRYEATALLEYKRARSVWDPDVARYRCPPGTEFGGRITNRIGAGCGSGIVRGALRAVRRGTGKLDNRLRARQLARMARIEARNAKKKPKIAKLADAIDPDIHKAFKGRPVSREHWNPIKAFQAELGKLADWVDPDKKGPEPDWKKINVPKVNKKDTKKVKKLNAIQQAMANLADAIDPDAPTPSDQPDTEPGDQGQVGKLQQSFDQVQETVNETQQAVENLTDTVQKLQADADKPEKPAVIKPKKKVKKPLVDVGKLNDNEKEAFDNALEELGEKAHAEWVKRLKKDEFTVKEIEDYIKEREGKVSPPYLNRLRRLQTDRKLFYGKSKNVRRLNSREAGPKSRSFLKNAIKTAASIVLPGESAPQRAALKPGLPEKPDIPGNAPNSLQLGAITGVFQGFNGFKTSASDWRADLVKVPDPDNAVALGITGTNDVYLVSGGDADAITATYDKFVTPLTEKKVDPPVVKKLVGDDYDFADGQTDVAFALLGVKNPTAKDPVFGDLKNAKAAGEKEIEDSSVGFMHSFNQATALGLYTNLVSDKQNLSDTLSSLTKAKNADDEKAILKKAGHNNLNDLAYAIAKNDGALHELNRREADHKTRIDTSIVAKVNALDIDEVEAATDNQMKKLKRLVDAIPKDKHAYLSKEKREMDIEATKVLAELDMLNIRKALLNAGAVDNPPDKHSKNIDWNEINHYKASFGKPTDAHLAAAKAAKENPGEPFGVLQSDDGFYVVVSGADWDKYGSYDGVKQIETYTIDAKDIVDTSSDADIIPEPSISYVEVAPDSPNIKTPYDIPDKTFKNSKGDTIELPEDMVDLNESLGEGFDTKARMLERQDKYGGLTAEQLDTKFTELKGRFGDETKSYRKFLKQAENAETDEAREEALRQAQISLRYIAVDMMAVNHARRLNAAREHGKSQAKELADASESQLQARMNAAQSKYLSATKKADEFKGAVALLDDGPEAIRSLAAYRNSKVFAERHSAEYDELKAAYEKKVAAFKEGIEKANRANQYGLQVQDYGSHMVRPHSDGVLNHAPVTNDAIGSLELASAHLAEGGSIREIPDGFVREAVLANSGPSKRFKRITAGVDPGINFIKGGEDHATVVVGDTLTGQKYVLKKPMRDDREYLREQSAQVVAQMLGMPSSTIRVDSGLYEFQNTDHKGLTRNRSLIMEHVDNIVLGDVPTGGEAYDMDALGRLLVFDTLLQEFDRHGDNRISKVGSDGKIRIIPIDHGKSFTPWDSQLAGGKPPPGLDHSMSKMAASRIKDIKDKKALVSAMRRARKQFDSDEFRARLKRLGQDAGYDTSEKKFLTDIGSFVDGQLAQFDEQFDDFVKALPGGELPKQYEFVPSEVSVTQVSNLLAVKQAPHMDVMPFVHTAYDGPEIEDMNLRLRDVTMDGSPATEIQFKMTPDRVESFYKMAMKDGSGWTRAEGISLPAAGKAFPIDGSFTTKAEGPAGSSKGYTFYKKLDDGSFAFVFVHKKGGPTVHGKKQRYGSFNGMVRIGTPTVASELDESVTKGLLGEVGIKSHGPPSVADVEELATNKLIASFIPYLARHDPNLSPQDHLKTIQTKYGIGPDDVDVTMDQFGQPIFQLSDEKLDQVIEQANIGYFTHRPTGYATSEDFAQMVITGIQPTSQRWSMVLSNHGMSSQTDAFSKQSGDYVFTNAQYSKSSQNVYQNLIDGNGWSGSSGRFVLGPQRIGRLGWMAFDGDKYGNNVEQKSLETAQHGYGGSETIFKGTQALTRHDRLVAASAQKRNEILDLLKKAKVYAVDGLPIEEFVVTK